MLKYLRGWLEAEIRGASPERCLNSLTAGNIPFWKLERQDEFTLRLRLYRSDWERARTEITRSLCVGRILRGRGFYRTFRGLKKRPVLLFGLILVLILAYLAQNVVWFVCVEGNERIPTSRILQILEEEGVRFGAWGPDLDSQFLKDRMLNRIPELRWLAVNLQGCIARVPVSERGETEPIAQNEGVANVVAARDGVLTELRVLNGLAVKEAGDAVREGDLLVSGLIECPTHTQATRAAAEVFADTRRRVRLIIPDTYGEKTYTGREMVCKTIIFQSFRRKISGNSSIFGTSCDRITKTEPLTLPGGYSLPLALETVTLREYRLTPKALTPEEKEEILRSRAQTRVRRELIAGTIRSADYTIKQEHGICVCTAEMSCSELISRTVPILLLGEDETYGENHQRGTD